MQKVTGQCGRNPFLLGVGRDDMGPLREIWAGVTRSPILSRESRLWPMTHEKRHDLL